MSAGAHGGKMAHREAEEKRQIMFGVKEENSAYLFIYRSVDW